MIYSGFQAVGKSTFVKNNPALAVDVESSKYDKSDKSWYVKYVDEIEKANASDFRYIFVSSHQCVQEEIIRRDLPLTLVYPKVCGPAYCNRLYARFSATKLVKDAKALSEAVMNGQNDVDRMRLLAKANANTVRVIELEDNEYISDRIHVPGDYRACFEKYDNPDSRLEIFRFEVADACKKALENHYSLNKYRNYFDRFCVIVGENFDARGGLYSAEQYAEGFARAFDDDNEIESRYLEGNETEEDSTSVDTYIEGVE